MLFLPAWPFRWTPQAVSRIQVEVKGDRDRGATEMGVKVCGLEPFRKRSPTKSPESWRTRDGGEG